MRPAVRALAATVGLLVGLASLYLGFACAAPCTAGRGPLLPFLPGVAAGGLTAFFALVPSVRPPRFCFYWFKREQGIEFAVFSPMIWLVGVPAMAYLAAVAIMLVVMFLTFFVCIISGNC